MYTEPFPSLQSAATSQEPLDEIVRLSERLCERVLTEQSTLLMQDLAVRVWFQLKCLRMLRKGGNCGLAPLERSYDWRRDAHWT